MSHPTAAHILATAPRVFADRGFAGASTRSLAEACGVNIGTLAYHFGNKEGLYHAVIDQVYTHILACLCLLYTSPSPRDQRGSRMPSSA